MMKMKGTPSQETRSIEARRREDSENNEILQHIDESVAKRVKELDEFHNSSSSDRQVAAMNSIVDEQKVNVFSRALDEISEVAMNINPQSAAC